MLTFAHSWVFWLVPLPLIIRRLVPPRRRTLPAVRVPFLSRLQSAIGAGPVNPLRRSNGPLMLRGVAWLLVIAALARPQWLEPPIERSIPTRDLLLLVDLSASMDQEDFASPSGESIDRLTAAKNVLGEFLTRREGDRVGLIVFGSAPFVQVPFTTDLALCRRLLDETEVGMAGPRTALGDAIGLAIQLFDNSDTPTRTIIALTDGNDTGSGVPPTEAARVAKDREVTIHTVAMGDPATVGEEQLDVQALQDVAKTTGGESFLAMNRGELAGIYSRLDEIETREIKTVSHRPRRDLYFWPLAAALLFSLSTHVGMLWIGRSHAPTDDSRVRLRVNARTFELEVVEQ